jgi:MFS family permease
MEGFALGWLVVLIAAAEGVPERAALYLGLVSLARMAPAVLLGPIAGVAVDRVDRRLLLIISQATTGIPVVLLGAAAVTGTVGLWVVLVASTILTVASLINIPTRSAIQPRLVGEHDLPSAIGLTSVVHNVAWLVGPLLGGILIVPFGVGGVLIVGGLGQLLVMAALAFLPPYPVMADGPHPSLGRSIVDGLRFVRSHALLFWLLVAFGASELLLGPSNELMPALAREVLRLGPVQLSWLLAAASVGSVSGIVVASLRGLQRFPIVTVGAMMLAALLLALFVRQRDVAALLLLAAGFSFARDFAGSSINLIIQTTTPDQLRGRVNSLFNLMIEIAVATGTLLVGAIATAVGVDGALTYAGFVLVVVCIGVLSRPAVGRSRTLASAQTARGSITKA